MSNLIARKCHTRTTGIAKARNYASKFLACLRRRSIQKNQKPNSQQAPQTVSKKTCLTPRPEKTSHGPGEQRQRRNGLQPFLSLWIGCDKWFQLSCGQILLYLQAETFRPESSTLNKPFICRWPPATCNNPVIALHSPLFPTCLQAYVRTINCCISGIWPGPRLTSYDSPSQVIAGILRSTCKGNHSHHDQ